MRTELALLVALAACTDSAATRIEVVVAVGGDLVVDELRAELGPHSASARADEQLQLFIDDALAGHPSSLQLWALASNIEVGHGATTVTPIAHDSTIATVTITALTSGCDCSEPRPASACVGDALRVYDGPPTCGAGTCGYGYTDRACAGGCLDDRCVGEWLYPTQTVKPAARFAHTAVWTGTEMIIWGGASSTTFSFGDGARYNPTTGAWTAISATNAPAARRQHSAVWTGTEMVVWGGSAISQGTPYADGGRYNPTTDTWTTIPATTTPGGRFGHSAVWTGSEMIVWGGAVSSVDSASNGARYNPATGAWTAISATGAPAPRRDHSAVWTGSEMIVWGGSELYAGPGYANAAAFDPAINTWTPTVTTGTAPGGRAAHAVVWTGDQMIIWAGAYSSTQTYADGAQLSPALGTWLFLPVQGRPTARRQLPAVWTGTSMLAWGGSDISDGNGSSQMIELRLYAP